MSCMDSKESISSQIPHTTSEIEFFTNLTSEMVKESNGLAINDDGSIVHVSSGQAKLLTKLIQPSFLEFHTGFMGYLYNEKAIFSEFRNRVKVQFRLTINGGKTWSEWNDDLDILSTENIMSDNEPDDRFGYLLSGSFPEKLYNGVQVRIVSEEINQGQEIIDLLRFSFERKSTEWFEMMERNREERVKKNSKNNPK